MFLVCVRFKGHTQMALASVLRELPWYDSLQQKQQWHKSHWCPYGRSVGHIEKGQALLHLHVQILI